MRPVLAAVGALVLGGTLVAAQPSSQLEQRVSRLESQVAALTLRVSSLEASSDSASPWRLAFDDDLATFDRSRYSFYPWGWKDTSKNGSYDPAIVTGHDGMVDVHLHTSADGVIHVAAFQPIVEGSLNFLYGRTEIRFRADALRGYKTAWLLWPGSGVWPRDGEIDFPEGDLNGTISAFMHRQGATSASDQDAFPTSARYPDWHTAVTEWGPGRATFLLDGQVVGVSSDRVPNTPMHWVIQSETTLAGFLPDPSTEGHILIDSIRVWRPA